MATTLSSKPHTTYMYIYIYIFMCVCVHIYICIFMYIYMCVYVRSGKEALMAAWRANGDYLEL